MVLWAHNVSVFGFSDSEGALMWLIVSEFLKKSCFILTEKESVVFWVSKKEGLIAVSSCAAAIVPLLPALQELGFLQVLLSFFFFLTTTRKHGSLFGEYQGTLALARKPKRYKLAWAIEVPYQFIRPINRGKAHCVFLKSHRIHSYSSAKRL